MLVIFGVGTDIVQLARIEATYRRFGKHFVDRLLMEEERQVFETSKNPTRFLAMRFAAKEATVKAMGTGFAHGVWIRDVGVLNNDWGRPRGDVILPPRYDVLPLENIADKTGSSRQLERIRKLRDVAWIRGGTLYRLCPRGDIRKTLNLADRMRCAKRLCLMHCAGLHTSMD